MKQVNSIYLEFDPLRASEYKQFRRELRVIFEDLGIEILRMETGFAPEKDENTLDMFDPKNGNPNY